MTLVGQKVVFPAPGVAELESIEVDEGNLGSTDVVVRAEVTLISPGTEPMITHRLAPAQIQAAYDGLRDRKDEFLGVVLEWA